MNEDIVTKPEKGTPEYDLWVAAIEVATYPPLTGAGFTTQVPRSRIDALRTALDGVGIDWEKAKRMDDDSRKKRGTK